MHFQLLTTLTLAGLAVSQPFLTTPTNTTTTSSVLTKRDDKPWIGSHYLPSCATTGDVLPSQMNGRPQSDNKYITGDRPKLTKNSCTYFAPQTNNIGVYWGTGSSAFSALKVYSTWNCKGEPVNTIFRKGFESGACFGLKDVPGMSAVMAAEQAVIVH